MCVVLWYSSVYVCVCVSCRGVLHCTCPGPRRPWYDLQCKVGDRRQRSASPAFPQNAWDPTAVLPSLGLRDALGCVTTECGPRPGLWTGEKTPQRLAQRVSSSASHPCAGAYAGGGGEGSDDVPRAAVTRASTSRASITTRSAVPTEMKRRKSRCFGGRFFYVPTFGTVGSSENFLVTSRAPTHLPPAWCPLVSASAGRHCVLDLRRVIPLPWPPRPIPWRGRSPSPRSLRASWRRPLRRARRERATAACRRRRRQC